MEILEKIKEFIEAIPPTQTSFYKSELRKVGIEPATSHEWLKLIEFCQKNIPEIHVVELSRNLIVELAGKKHE